MRSILAVLLLALVVSTPALAQRAEAFFDQSFAFQRGDDLEVATSSPEVVIETGGREARVRVEGSGPRAREFYEHMRFTAEHRDGRLVVRTNPQGSFRSVGRSPSLRIVVTIPERANVDTRTSSGNITIGDLRGDLRASASSGTVHVGDVEGGTIQISTSSGNIRGGALTGRTAISTNASSGRVRLGAVTGPSLSHRSSSGSFSAGLLEVAQFDARSSSGNISVEGVSGSSDVRTSSGRISLGEVGGAVSARASSGSIELSVRQAAPLDLRTSSGAVTINAPSRLAADIDLRGRTFDIARGLNFQGDEERRRVRGHLNGGGPQINVQTSSGRIRLTTR